MKKGEKERKKEIMEMLGKNTNPVIEKVVEEVIFLENKMEELKQLPFIRISERNQMIQRATPAAKQYKELIQQYTNCVKIICKVANNMDENAQDSPLREWFRKYNANKQKENMDS